MKTDLFIMASILVTAISMILLNMYEINKTTNRKTTQLDAVATNSFIKSTYAKAYLKAQLLQ